MKSIISINNIIDNYDNFIIDQWGVMHDGAFGFDHAFDSINILSRNKKSLFIISNTSKRSNLSYNNLTNLGFNKDLFLNILTSGEMIWQQLNTNFLNLNPKKNCFHIFDESKEDGLLIREGLNLNFVEKIDDADIILACTPFIGLQPSDYIPLLEAAFNKGITMYCANPDYEVVESKSNKNIFCMGAIAEIYKNMGGSVIIQGKPDISIYLETTKIINLQKKRTIAIGDSLFHDIKGANNFEIDSVLVKSGIHKDNNTINNIIKNHKITPTFIIDKFSI